MRMEAVKPASRTTLEIKMKIDKNRWKSMEIATRNSLDHRLSSISDIILIIGSG